MRVHVCACGPAPPAELPAVPRAGRDASPSAAVSGDTMVPWAWCLLLGLCALLPSATPQREDPEDPAPQDPPGDPERCGITFHAPNPCGPPAPSLPSASRQDLEHLQNLLQQTRARLRDVEEAAAMEDPQPRYRDVITEALPVIRGANQEFGESLENVRRELEAHVAESHRPEAVEKREKLRRDVRVLAHVLRLTARLAHALDASSQRLQDELSQRLQLSAARAAAAQP